MKHLTIRDVPPSLARALARETRRRQQSLNQTVKDLLEQALGLSSLPFDNSLGRLAGGWSEADLEAFEAAVRPLDEVDPELWPELGPELRP